jgi:hypothetical protein
MILSTGEPPFVFFIIDEPECALLVNLVLGLESEHILARIDLAHIHEGVFLGGHLVRLTAQSAILLGDVRQQIVVVSVEPTEIVAFLSRCLIPHVFSLLIIPLGLIVNF